MKTNIIMGIIFSLRFHQLFNTFIWLGSVRLTLSMLMLLLFMKCECGVKDTPRMKCMLGEARWMLPTYLWRI